MSRDKEEEAWGRLEGWKLAARVGGGSALLLHALQHPAAGVCRLTEQASNGPVTALQLMGRRWISWRSRGVRRGVPGTLLVPGWDTDKRWKKERQSWTEDR